MAFSPRTWLARTVQNPGRKTLTPTGNTNEYDEARSEGNITQAGDLISAENLNDLETRIGDAFTAIASESGLTALNGWSALYPIVAKRSEKIVSITGAINSGTATSNTILFTLPSDMHPAHAVWVCAFDAVTKLACGIVVDTSGNVKIDNTLGEWTSNIHILNFCVYTA